MDLSGDDPPPRVAELAGQLAESKSFVKGYRSAWFRCKIKDISRRRNRIGFTAEYYDFPDEEEKWTKLYQVPCYGKKSKGIKKHLMVRPHYPPVYHESQLPDINSISEVIVIIEGAWKVGNLVDWHEQNCYWSGRVTQMDGDKVQIELPEPPAGEGGSYKASVKDLRPSLDWSPEYGWRFPTPENGVSCSALLLYPMDQAADAVSNLNMPPIDGQPATRSPFNASFSSHISSNSLPSALEEVTAKLTPERAVGMTGDVQQMQEVDVDPGEGLRGITSSSESICTSHVQEAKGATTGEDMNYSQSHGSYARRAILLNSMYADTLDAAVLDLEEVANKIKWIKGVLKCGSQLPNDTRSS